MTQRLVISAGLSAVEVLYPILKAQLTEATISYNPLMIAQAIFGLVQLGTATAALIAYEQKAMETSKQLRGLQFMFSNISMGLNVVGML
jgi:hypothetical protein